jgi:Fic family protein
VPDAVTDLDLGFVAREVEAITQAERAVRELQGSTSIAGLEALSHQLLRAESVASSWIEGLELSQRRLARALFDDGAADRTALAVMGNIEAMEEAVRLGVRASALGREDVLLIHRRLLERTRDAPIAGLLRECQNWVGGNSASPDRAVFIPPPESEVPRLIDDLCVFMNRVDLPAIAQAAVAHAQFETIHPFAEGNGRVGRALIHVILLRRTVVDQFVPPISLVLAANVRRYVDGLTAFREGRSGDWVEFFARALADAASSSVKLGKDLLVLQEAWRTATHRPRRGSAADKLIRSLPRRPILDVNAAAQLVGLSYPQAREAVLALAAAGVLKQINVGRRRNRAWEAPEVMALLDDFEYVSATPTREGEPRRPSPRCRAR